MTDLLFDFTEWRVSCGFSPAQLKVIFNGNEIKEMIWMEIK